MNLYPPITGAIGSSFARFTIQNRLPAIIDGIISDNELEEKFCINLIELKANILYDKVSILPRHGNDIVDWKIWLQQYLGKSWFELPFYFAEAYFYRLTLDCINYFENHLDPFSYQKQNDIDINLARFESILEHINDQQSGNPSKKELFKTLLKISLWGNKSDLSQLHLNRETDSTKLIEHTIIDDSEQLISKLKFPCQQIDIILDNSGIELFTDLILAEKMISSGFCNQVVLHAKAFPTFVSDATESDIQLLLSRLLVIDNQAVREFVKSINLNVDQGKIIITSHKFWNSPLHFFELPVELKNSLTNSELLIIKGDANYRRIFGDRIIPFDTDPLEITQYLPSNALAIRILKSEIILGISSNLVQEVAQKDKDWLINGEWGILQLIKESLSF